MSLTLLHSCSSDALATLQARVLGGLRVGATRATDLPAWPLQDLCTPVLDPGGVLQECWCETGDAAMRSGVSEGVAWRRSGGLLFGAIQIEESALASAPGRTPLQQAAFEAYARIFRLLDAQGLPHLWRLWNYMADIHGEADTLERYRQFNIGRAQAFEAGARSVVGRVPAACALGVAAGPLSIAFLAAESAIVPVENPRQVSAFHYPVRYGPRSPTFARAALAHPPGQEILFLSGTASIVGHETVHPGDVRAQTDETLDNIAAVLAAASDRSKTGRFGLADLGYRVYVRHAANADAVREVLAQRLGAAPLSFVQADVCRTDLLVEIEGQAIRAFS